MNLSCSLWFNLGTPRIILLRSPALGNEQAILAPLPGSCCVFRGNLWEQSTTGGNSSIGNFVPFFPLILFLFFLFVFNLFCLIGIHCCMSIWVRKKRGRLEIFETYFGNLFDPPFPSPSSSIMVMKHVIIMRRIEELCMNYCIPCKILFLHASCFHLMHHM